MNDAAELLRRYADQDDNEAFAGFVHQYFNLVYSAALRQVWGDTHASADIAQSVFTDAARQARVLASHPAIVGWLYTSTYFWAAKFRRAEQRRRRREQVAYAMNDVDLPPAADWIEVRPQLDAALQALPTRDREAVLLRFFEQMPFAAIAAKLGIQENAAQMRVSRALEKLRSALARRGVTSTAAALGTVLANEAVAAAPQGVCTAVTSAALAKAGGSGLGVATLAWHFMITSKTTIGTIGVLTAVAVGCGWYATTQARHSAASARRDQQELAHLTTAIQAIEARLAPSQREAGPAPTPASAAPDERTAAPAALAELTRSLGREMTENPQLRRSLGARERAKFHLDHLELYRQLGLTAEQIDAIERNRLKGGSEELDLMEAAAELANTPLTTIINQSASLPSLANARKQVVAREYEVLRPILGDQALGAFEDFERLLPARSAVTQAMSSLVFSDSPLNATERADLVRTIAAHNPAYQLGGSVDLTTVDWPAVLADASSRLTPAQLARLRTLSESARSNSAAASDL